MGLILYGTEGIGKTGLALQFSIFGPLTCISIGEHGYDDLAIINEVPAQCTNYNISTWEELEHTLKKVQDGVVVIDSLSGLQKILFNYVCRIEYDGNWSKFTEYWKGQRVDSPLYFQKLLDKLEIFRSVGIHVILLGHYVTIPQPNATGADFLCHTLDLDDGEKVAGLRSLALQWAQATLFLNIDININRVTNSDRTTKLAMEGKAIDTDNRIMYTSKSPVHAAKNKLALPPVIPMGSSAKEAFNNLFKSLPEVYRNAI